MAIIKFKTKIYSDAEYVDGVFRRDPVMEHALHGHCKRYFNENYRGVFFVGDEHKDEIFQETFVQLWLNIEKRNIYVERGELLGKDGNPLKGKLTTYFMGIAKRKYLEWVRDNCSQKNIGLECMQNGHSKMRSQLTVKDMEIYKDMLYDEEEEDMLGIIADCISHISERCNQILTMFYYEKKTLDDIMAELPTFESKNALKTAKYKCMETLRKTANEIFHRQQNG